MFTFSDGVYCELNPALYSKLPSALYHKLSQVALVTSGTGIFRGILTLLNRGFKPRPPSTGGAPLPLHPPRLPTVIQGSIILQHSRSVNWERINLWAWSFGFTEVTVQNANTLVRSMVLGLAGGQQSAFVFLHTESFLIQPFGLIYVLYHFLSGMHFSYCKMLSVVSHRRIA